jgi:hypothetical protein
LPDASMLLALCDTFIQIGGCSLYVGPTTNP